MLDQAGDPIANQKLRRAVDLHHVVLTLDRERQKWRLSPGAFIANACEKAGITEADIPELAARLDAVDAVDAKHAVRRMADEFARGPYRPDAPGWLGRLNPIEAGALGAFNLSPAKACAVAAYLAVQGHDPTNDDWGGTASREGEAAELQDQARAERDELVRELEPAWARLPLTVSDVDDAGRASIYVCGKVSPRPGFFGALMDALVADPAAMPVDPPARRKATA